MPISDWKDMMPVSVSLQAPSTRDNYGKVTAYGAATSYKARVTFKSMRVVSRVTGQDTLVSGAVWINGVVTTLTPDWKLTLPDSSTPKIESWDVNMDEVGNHHTKIYFS